MSGSTGNFLQAHRQETPIGFALFSGMSGVVDPLVSHLAQYGLHLDPQAEIQLILDAPTGYALKLLETPNVLAKRIVITWNACPEYCDDLWDLEVDVLINGCSSVNMLATAIGYAANGKSYRIPSLSASPLTQVERRVLHMLARGFSNQEIAEQLVLRHQTVRNVLTTIYTKLYLRGRNEAILYYWGILPGFVSLPVSMDQTDVIAAANTHERLK